MGRSAVDKYRCPSGPFSRSEPIPANRARQKPRKKPSLEQSGGKKGKGERERERERGKSTGTRSVSIARHHRFPLAISALAPSRPRFPHRPTPDIIRPVVLESISLFCSMLQAPSSKLHAPCSKLLHALPCSSMLRASCFMLLVPCFMLHASCSLLHAPYPVPNGVLRKALSSTLHLSSFVAKFPSG